MKGSTHVSAVGPAAAPEVAASSAARPTHLTVAELAVRWGISAYTIREWARTGRITDCRLAHGEWVFLESARFRLTRAAAEGHRGAETLLDFAAYPVTVAELATLVRCNHDTIRRRARAGQYTPAVHTPLGWRFGAGVLDPSFPVSGAASCPSGASGTASGDRDADPLAGLRNLNFDVRRLGVPPVAVGTHASSAAGSASPSRKRRGPQAIYRR
ncbi:MAG TPA: DNA-binding protein [Gemmatimonas aurantiaca]|jgi:hypothetical protein|uniref:DNA-binding protein n=2 Tax=Gemmatimonas aurantiaca TaxID=173480 RepID=C1A814_GEMAT|nr:helix-turn-helix domain-containing protein [Gemmatimonas aurantiaca]BAH38374.1 hypothetical protein GAU_1332 [Gemmatimonas aurantiaca T-27]HCT56294.1 DNA-binding protein [Gemmatimonas aurantiaca]